MAVQYVFSGDRLTSLAPMAPLPSLRERIMVLSGPRCLMSLKAFSNSMASFPLLPFSFNDKIPAIPAIYETSKILLNENFSQIGRCQGVIHVHPQTGTLYGLHSPLVINGHLHFRGILRHDRFRDFNGLFQFCK